MQISRSSVSPRAFQAQRPARKMTVLASTRPDVTSTGRREALIAGGAMLLGAQLAAPNAAFAQKLRDVEIPVKSLSSFQKSDELEDYRLKAEKVIKEILTKDDAADAVRLGLRCAATYDVATNTGGFNGSIILNPAELSRPENASLRPFAEKIKTCKAAVDEVVTKMGSAPISYADVMVLAVKVTHQAKWVDAKVKIGNEDAAYRFPNPWPVTLGRIDSDVAGPNHLPADDAPVAEIRAALSAVGVKPGEGSGPLSPKPVLWEKPGMILWCAGAKDEASEEARFAAADPVYAELKRKYDLSRDTVTRTNYEVDFVQFFSRASTIGVKFDASRYLHPITMQTI